jgi:DNA-binding beta-propeller fold protein YncE
MSDSAFALAISPDGTNVYVTGSSSDAASGFDYATIAYDASTGAKIWVKRYDGPYISADQAYALAISPDGTKVYVTGESLGSGADTDYATLAYEASTGATVWTRRYDGPGNSGDRGNAVAVSHDGTRLYVTGSSIGSTSAEDYATIAYDASTGGKIWVKRYDGPGNSSDHGNAVAVNADGTKVYVTGYSTGPTSGKDYTTIAYDASNGAKIWVKRYNGPGNGDDQAYSIAVDGGGAMVYVTGGSLGSTTEEDYATIAYEG